MKRFMASFMLGAPVKSVSARSTKLLPVHRGHAVVDELRDFGGVLLQRCDNLRIGRSLHDHDALLSGFNRRDDFVVVCVDCAQRRALDRQPGIDSGFDLLPAARDVVCDQFGNLRIVRLRHRADAIREVRHRSRHAIVVGEQFVDGTHLRHGAGILATLHHHHSRTHALHCAPGC
jgi:hypothetical protein